MDQQKKNPSSSTSATPGNEKLTGSTGQQPGTKRHGAENTQMGAGAQPGAQRTTANTDQLSNTQRTGSRPTTGRAAGTNDEAAEDLRDTANTEASDEATEDAQDTGATDEVE